MKKYKKNGFKEFIRKSLPLQTTNPEDKRLLLRTGDKVFYMKDHNPTSVMYHHSYRRYGRIRFYERGCPGKLWCDWIDPGSFTYMPISKLYIEVLNDNDSYEVVPIIDCNLSRIPIPGGMY